MMTIPNKEILIKLEPIMEGIDAITKDLTMQEIALVIGTMISATICQFELKEQNRRLVELMVFSKEMIASMNSSKDK